MSFQRGTLLYLDFCLYMCAFSFGGEGRGEHRSYFCKSVLRCKKASQPTKIATGTVAVMFAFGIQFYYPLVCDPSCPSFRDLLQGPPRIQMVP